MKRKDIIKKLVKEGLTEKTLVNMNDKQLKILSERIFSEQYSSTTIAATVPTTNSPSILNIPKTDQVGINSAKQQKKTFATYEGEVKEMEDPKLGAEKKEYSEKEIVIKRSNAKIKSAIKDGKEYDDYTRAIKKVNNGKLPESTQKIIDTKKLNEWVNKAVEKNIHPFTSKGEIMELINTKLTEQVKPWEDDDVDLMDAGQGAPMPKETEVEPDVIPGRPRTNPGVDPDDPFRDPHPGIDPGPKARKTKRISPEEAKNKIIELLKQIV
jgi:hypothetical protein